MDHDQQRPRLDLDELHRTWASYGHEMLLHDPGGEAECLVRRGELLAPADSLDTVLVRCHRWVDRVHHDEDLLLARIRLREAERDHCVELAWETPGVSVNNVHLGSPVMFGAPVMWGTGGEPECTPPLPEPPAAHWDPPVVVGVLDTGCDPHPWFADRPGFVAVPEELDADDDSGQDRQAGHGTFVSGVVLQHAPGVVLRPQRVLSSLGFTDDRAVAAGLRALRRSAQERGEQVDVVVLTSGCHTADDRCPELLAAELSAMAPAVVVAAAGNHGHSRPFWPAAAPEVLGVAATGSDGKITGFSGTGDWVGAAAPGVDVRSCFVRLAPGGGRRFGYASWSGTSFAAPRVAAAIATVLQLDRDPERARELVEHCYPYASAVPAPVPAE
ncbi:S8 family peptidase [Saccharopolyspora rhizosphaerae]|uniref:S8 family peptidase n=1 Tax=Saccharopolyspora rhizosphaerae TaxID=2492662 RepID=UPI001F22CBC2|nr:S8 family serine peptidase [Saccharopolyspora rhizosphaerae]